MTKADMITKLTVITGENDLNVLSVYLDFARDAILGRLYPFGGYDPSVYTVVPSPYDMTQVNIAAYLLNKRGAEGEISHSENGVSRTYEGGHIPDSMLRNVVPMAAAPIKEAVEDEASKA